MHQEQTDDFAGLIAAKHEEYEETVENHLQNGPI
jgi:hypothetical protein